MWQGKLTDGTVFDSSFERGDPFEFKLGSGQVIKGSDLLLAFEYLFSFNIFLIPSMVIFGFVAGWDQGLLGACVGEKRKLKIPAKLGYGEQGSPPTIPGINTLHQ
jgi:FK506-binding protein 2